MKKKLTLLRFALSLLLIPFLAMGVGGFFAFVTDGSHPVYAATDANVTVNATPAYVSISNNTTTWVLNGITGSSVITPNTVYYANPKGDTTAPSGTVDSDDCHFGLTDSSTVNIDLTVTSGNFTGGDANMNNSEDGSNGATTYGAYSWYDGLLYASKVVTRSGGSATLKTGHSGSLAWGTEIETQTNSWTGGTTSTTTLTISAVAS